MAEATKLLTNFTAGEISPRLYGRTDLAKYSNAAREITNGIVMPHGGVRKRGASRYVNHVRAHLPEARLVEFVFTTEQAYILEFSRYRVRVFKDRGSVIDVSYNITGISVGVGGVITVTALGHTFANGDAIIPEGIVGMTELNGREFFVDNVASNTFKLKKSDFVTYIDGTDYTPYVSGGTANRIYEIATVYTEDDVPGLTFTQSADTLYIFSPRWPTATLQRTAHAAWTYQFANIEEGPFLDFNTNIYNRVSIDVAVGTGVMVFTYATLNIAHEGALFRIWEEANGSSFGYATWAPGAAVTVNDGTFWEYNGNVYYVVSGGGGVLGSTAAFPRHTQDIADVFYGGGTARMLYMHSGYCVVQVDTVLSTQVALITVVGKYRTPYTAYGARSSPVWQEGAWSDYRGYPRTGQIHEQRLVAYSTEYEPAKRWSSITGAYLNFRDGDEDDDGYSYVSAANQVAAIKFAVSTKRMVELSTSAELVMSASRADEAITPTNVKISPETNYGVTDVRPVLAGPAVLFVQRKGKNTNPGRRVREFVYNFQTDSYVAPDLTILSEHITKPGLVSGAFQAAPDLVVWYARADGAMVGMTYERDQQVVGWHKHGLGANSDGSGVQCVATIPGDEGDEVWMIVSRVIDGEEVRYIEWMQEGLLDTDELEDSKYLDCSLFRDGSPTNTVSGLWHLEGEVVSAFADSRVYHNLTVTNGRIYLPDDVEAAKILIGYNYRMTVKTLRVEEGARQGTAQGQLGKIDRVMVRLDRTVGGKMGVEDENGQQLDPIQYREADEPISDDLELFSGDKKIPVEGRWDMNRYAVIVQDEPYPMHLIAVTLGLSVSG